MVTPRPAPKPAPAWLLAAGAASMLLLYVVPLDMMTTPLWMILAVVWLATARALWRELWGARRPAALLACACGVVLWPGSCVTQLSAWADTQHRVQELAERAQRACEARGQCPDARALCGADGCGTAGTTVRHELHYQVSDDARSFVVSARLTIDDFVRARGGVGRPLETRTLSDHDRADAAR